MKVSDLQINSKLYPLEPKKVTNQAAQTTGTAAAGKSEGMKPFAEILQDQIKENSGVRFSAHALKRLQERQLGLSPQELSRLDNGVKQLDEKGSTNSVVLIDDTAYIVSVKNKTVVTAVDNTKAAGNIFTNVDSVAIV